VGNPQIIGGEVRRFVAKDLGGVPLIPKRRGEGSVVGSRSGRVHVKMVFACLCFNLVQLGSLGGGVTA